MVAPVDEPLVAPPVAVHRAGLLAGWREPGSPVPTYVGVFLVCIGFTLMLYTWSKVAGEVLVADQLPYVASAALPGFALVVLGIACIAVAAKWSDAHRREAQLRDLIAALRDRDRG